ncbi:hypothetical protein AAVH_12127 [Aphelenchoides avenae]|nr:hypothetical protein AAVH_12127 [Aphelenchus avenae]
MLPDDTLADVFIVLDRDSLDATQLTCVHFCIVVDSRMNGVCKRLLSSALFGAKPSRHNSSEPWYYATINRKRPPTMFADDFDGLAEATDCLISRTRHAIVNFLCVEGDVSSWLLQCLFSQPSACSVDTLAFRNVRLLMVEAQCFADFVTHFEVVSSLRFYSISCSKLTLTGDFLRQCAAKGVTDIDLRSVNLNNEDGLDVIEEHIIEFLYGRLTQNKPRALFLDHVHVLRENFLQRLIEESQRTPITEDISLYVAPVAAQAWDDPTAKVTQTMVETRVEFEGEMRLQFSLVGATLAMRRGLTDKTREQKFFFDDD